ncbi:outer membrane protein [Helicobacter mustelae]|uniref:outer membrane beta-barrel protein n=1 Tax=Helicobacter mustelae TaxID=217 RepID=UPI000E079EC9|nr:outer membrane beta-barrel protein [Helicobacter mustelae]STP11914.1 outer membrane protein [Helicobacter mustelae]
MKKFLAIFFILLSSTYAKGSFLFGAGTDYIYEKTKYDSSGQKAQDWDVFATTRQEINGLKANINIGYEYLFFDIIGFRPMITLGYGALFSSKDNIIDRKPRNSLSLDSSYILSARAWLDLLINFPIPAQNLEVGFFVGGGAGIGYGNSTFKEKDLNSLETIHSFSEKTSLKQFLTRLGITFKINSQHRVDLFVIAPVYSIIDIKNSRYGEIHIRERNEFLPNSGGLNYYFLF